MEDLRQEVRGRDLRDPFAALGMTKAEGRRKKAEGRRLKVEG
jgi:hypothetical protein